MPRNSRTEQHGGASPDVLVVVNDLAPYGAQRVAVALVEEWSTGRRVALATVEDPSTDELPLPSGVARHRLRRRGPKAWALLSLALQLRRLERREKPRYVLAHMNFANIITLLALWGSAARPVIVEHNLLSRNLAVQPAGKVSGFLLRRLQGGASAVVGVSDAVVDDVHVEVGVPRARLHRIYNPVPHRTVVVQDSPHPWLRADRPGRTFVCAAAFRRAKGQDVLVDALALMRRRGDAGTRVIFIGGGPLDQAVLDRAHGSGVGDAVHLAGFQPDALAWISRADALVMPSRWDSFGLVAVEAARCGVPVLATDVPGLNEVVPRYAPGWLVPPDDAIALADALTDFPDQIGEPGRADLTDFEPIVAAERYWALLEEVAG